MSKEQGQEVEMLEEASLIEHKGYLESCVYRDHQEAIEIRLEQARNLLELETDIVKVRQMQGRIHELKVQFDFPERLVTSMEYELAAQNEEESSARVN